MKAIDCCDVSKTYGGRSRNAFTALDCVTLSLQPGEAVGLVGPNGAGKTTLLALLAGLLFPDRGDIRIFGHRARTLQARRLLRYMPETPAFLNGYTCRQTLEYHGALAGMGGGDSRDEAGRLLSLLDLQARAEFPTQALSQGAKQRLALAVALLGHPKILILDEPSNGLDPTGVIRLREILYERSKTGVAVLISSHRLSEMQKLTSRFLYLRNGRIVEPGQLDGDNRLRIEFVPSGNSLELLKAKWDVMDESENHAVVRIAGCDEIPSVVRACVAMGVEVTGVRREREDAEETFMRVYGEGK